MNYGISESATVTTVEKGKVSESNATTVRRMEKGVILESGSAPAMVRKIELKNHDFVVDKYSARRGMGVGKRISSEEFVIGGHRWAIYLYPEGVNDDAHNGGCASLYVTWKSESESESAEAVQFLIDLYIIDQSGKLEHRALSSFFFKEVRSLTSGDISGSPCFISREKLESRYLKNDSLKISVSIGVFTYHHESSTSVKVGVDFNKLLERQWQDEFVFFQVADHKTYCAAKSILAARCPALLSQHDVVFPDMDPKVFAVVLSFIYRGTLTRTFQKAIDDSDPVDLESFAAKLLEAADKFELKGLKKICELSISNKVCRESVVSLLHLADVCKAAELKSACLKFAAQNKSVIMESDGCELLKETCPLLFLELVGFRDDSLSTSRKEGVLNMYKTVAATVRESLVGVRESLVGRHCPWGLPNKKQKMKEL